MDLKKLKKDELLTEALEMKQTIADLTNQLTQAKKKTVRKTTIQKVTLSGGKKVTLAQAAKMIQESDQKITSLEESVSKLKNECHVCTEEKVDCDHRIAWLEGLLKEYDERKTKLENAIFDIKQLVKLNQPYYFYQFRKNWKVAKQILSIVKNLVTEDEND